MNLSAKSDTLSIAPYGGVTDSVKIAIKDIRLANIKMLERELYKESIKSYKRLLETKDSKITILESNIKIQKETIDRLYKEQSEYINTIYDYKRKKNILMATSIGLGTTIMILLLLK